MSQVTTRQALSTPALFWIHNLYIPDERIPTGAGKAPIVFPGVTGKRIVDLPMGVGRPPSTFPKKRSNNFPT